MPEPRSAASPAMIRQHLIAAQRLAWGDPLEHAAMQAGMTTDALRQREAEPDFQVVREAEEALLALDSAAWERRMDGQMRQAAERALIDGRVSTVNLLLKARLNLTSVTGKRAPRDLDDDKDEREDDEDDDEDGLDDEAWLATVPVVESDPEREAERRRALLKIEPKAVRRIMARGSLRSVEQHLVCGDPVARPLLSAAAARLLQTRISELSRPSASSWPAAGGMAAGDGLAPIARRSSGRWPTGGSASSGSSCASGSLCRRWRSRPSSRKAAERGAARARGAGGRGVRGRGDSTTRPGSRPCRWSRPTPSARPSGGGCCWRSSTRVPAMRSSTRPCSGIEQYSVAADPVAYEEWFARQPKPPRSRAKCLTAEDAAAVEWVTRHNPPWIRGQYLGYYRPPVSAHLFLPGAKGDDEPGTVIEGAPAESAAPAPRATTESPVAALSARIVRLLDRTAVRLPEEVDLAEAICALKWPKWPDYQGPIDPFLLRRALSDIRLDDGTINWLGSHELARACKSAAVKQPQGP